jgi:hypothetical protein
MGGYGEVLATCQGAKCEGSLGELDTNLSGLFEVCMVHMTSPSSCCKPRLADTCSLSVVAGASAIARAPPLGSERDDLCFPTVSEVPTRERSVASA